MSDGLLAQIAAQGVAAAGKHALSRVGAHKKHGGHRFRRRKALTASDISLMLQISSAVGKRAAENFILARVRGH